MTYLVFDMINVCSFLQEKGFQHGCISPEIILIDRNQKFYLGDKMKHAVKHPQNLIDKYLRNDKLYLSPEVFHFIKQRNSQGMHKINGFKSDTFIMGLSVLAVGLMTDTCDVFNKANKRIDQKKLQRYIQDFRFRYEENPLLMGIVKRMLAIDELRRPDFLDLKYSLPNYSELQRYFQKLRHKFGRRNRLQQNSQERRRSSSKDKDL